MQQLSAAQAETCAWKPRLSAPHALGMQFIGGVLDWEAGVRLGSKGELPRAIQGSVLSASDWVLRRLP